MKDLDRKVAVITGDAGGIGLAMAEAFGAEGMRLVLADVERGALDRAAQTLSDRGFEVVGVQCDVSRLDQVEALARTAISHFDHVHILCNNAGVSITGPVFKMSMDDWRWVYDVNVWGVIHGIKVFTPLLMAHGEEAHIVNTASLASFNGTGDHAPYCSSKAAVLSLSQALYSEMAAFNTNIGVSVVCPGMVDTAINKSWRNRPKADQPWSDREYADEGHVRASEQFQAVGVPPEEIAQLTLLAVKEGRFYVFNGERYGEFLERFLTPILKAENPPVQTWGPDLRPALNTAAANG